MDDKELFANEIKIPGAKYYTPPPSAILTGRDNKVQIPYGDLVIPLLNEDFDSLDGLEPSYDAVGRGIYYALRFNPDIPLASRYATLLRDAYPHIMAEIATNFMMLDKKDVDIPYLDRKITYLKIFALLDPENYLFPFQIGSTFFVKGLAIEALNNTTIFLYKAESYFKKALELHPGDVQVKYQLSELSFLLGKYNVAVSIWEDVMPDLSAEVQEKVRKKIELLKSDYFPIIPAVDYLQGAGVGVEAFEAGNYEEAIAIILDVLAALEKFEGLPLAELNYVVGVCYYRLDIPLYAETYLKKALKLQPDYPEALDLLKELGIEG